MNITANISAKPWYKEPWPWILMAGPAVTIVVCLLFLWLALTTNDGVVEDDYYEQGKNVNMIMQRDHLAREMGLSATIMLNEQDLRVFLTANADRLPEQLVLHLNHPTREGLDQDIVLERAEEGFYSGRLADAKIVGRRLATLEDTQQSWRLWGDWQPSAGASFQLLPH